MKIFLDLRSLQNKQHAGVARYTLTILQELQERNYHIIGICSGPIYSDLKLLKNIEIRSFKLMRIMPGSLFIMFFLPIYLSRYDIFLGLNHCVPLWGRFRRIIFIHDFVYKLFPNTQTYINKFLQGTSVRLGLFLSDSVVFVSRYTHEVYKSLYSKEDQRQDVVVIPNMPSVNKKSYPISGISKPFIFVLGSIEPRKNLIAILEAYSNIRKSHDIQLVIAGPIGWKNKEILQRINCSTYKKDIIFPGYLTNEQVSWGYLNCEIFCFPSLYEGYGIPPFEALLNGAKVVGTVFSELKYYKHANNLWLYNPYHDNLKELMLKALLEKKKVVNINISKVDLSLIEL